MDNQVKGREERGSALWGTGHRGGGDGRARTAWRSWRIVGTAVVGVVLALPVAASARPSDYHHQAGKWTGSYVSPALVTKAAATPDAKVRVIITADSSAFAAKLIKGFGQVGRKLDLVKGISATLPAKFIPKLQGIPGLTVTVDKPVKVLSNPTSNQLWPYSTGLANLYGTDTAPAPNAPTIAVVDSGIDTTKADFGNRLVANVNLTTLPGNSAGDGRGHGTFVAAIAAGSADGYAGASPNSNIVSLDVMDDQGMAYTSDVIAAANWILDNKDQYNIRVANFSLAGAGESSFQNDPLDKAVEKLWFSGVTVVAAAGNYGVATGPSGVVSAPGNDPFVITVGASDTNRTLTRADDSSVWWSAYGYTHDGFAKPELLAPGRYMVAAIPSKSTIATERPQNLVGSGYMQLSGTSFAAPVVAGAAAQVLARHPNWTPDQVKGALMASAVSLPRVTTLAQGMGELNAAAAARLITSPPNPNAGLNQFVGPDPNGGSAPVFDNTTWYQTAKANLSWNELSWNELSWNELSWNELSWNELSWNELSWNELSWNEVGDSESGPVDTISDADLAAAAVDPQLAPEGN